MIVEDNMAVVKRAAVAETSKTWEFGKLKCTLTRKSGSETERTKPNQGAVDTVTVINKDGETRGQSNGFMWSGPFSEFKELAGSIGGLYAAIEQELYGARSGDGCRCPVQHDLDCVK